MLMMTLKRSRPACRTPLSRSGCFTRRRGEQPLAETHEAAGQHLTASVHAAALLLYCPLFMPAVKLQPGRASLSMQSPQGEEPITIACKQPSAPHQGLAQ